MHNQKKDKKFKTKNNQNFQKIELYGSPTTKELKKKHSFRLVGGAEMGSWGRRGQVVRGRLEDRVVPHLLKINWEKQVGRETDHATLGSSMRKESLKISDYKNLWGLRQQEKLPASQESSLERPTWS